MKISPLDKGTIQAQALRGVLSLASRDIAIGLLGLGGSVVLARLLDPAAFGLFAIATYVVNIFAMFSELGLGAAFIRQPGEIRPREFNALFTFQLALVTGMALLLFVLAPLAAQVYGIPEVACLVRAVSLSLCLTSLRSVPTIIAERNLAYGPVALADVAGQVSYWITAITLALMHFGVWSLITALVVSSLAGVVVLYLRVAWRPALDIDWRPLRESVHFGLMYQGQSLAHFAKDTIVPSLGGIVFGSQPVGYLAWAQQISAVPLQLTQIVSRVSYPALAQLQGDRTAGLRLLETTLRWTCRISLPVFAVLVGLAPQLTTYVYGLKWLPALPALYFFCANMILGVGTGVLMPALYSLGRAGAALRISLIWALLTWLVALGLIVAGIAFKAIAIANALGTAVALGLIVHEVSKLGPVDLLAAVRRPVASGVGVGVALSLAGPVLSRDIWSLVGVAALAGAAGLALNLWPDRVFVRTHIRMLLAKRHAAAELFKG